jgi:dipeptidyl aminopeptidase/acylaminoacyl peptidase
VRKRSYWLRLLLFAVVALIIGLIGVPFVMGASTLWGLTHPACNPGGAPNVPYDDIAFPSTKNLTIHGYFIPGTNGATLIIAPAFSGGRGTELDYASIFHEAGFNVLTLESRSCSAQGWISLGYQEVDDVQAAYQYLTTRKDVDVARVGLHGFSSAGATVLMAAARMPQVKSVTSMGGYHDYASVLGLGESSNFFVTFYKLGAAAMYRAVTGDDIRILSPLSTLNRIAPRPVLLIYGSLERSLPGARQMLEQGRANGVAIDLWVVDGADHGDYLRVARDEFIRRVIPFHQQALLG